MLGVSGDVREISIGFEWRKRPKSSRGLELQVRRSKFEIRSSRFEIRNSSLTFELELELESAFHLPTRHESSPNAAPVIATPSDKSPFRLNEMGKKLVKFGRSRQFVCRLISTRGPSLRMAGSSRLIDSSADKNECPPTSALISVRIRCIREPRSKQTRSLTGAHSSLARRSLSAARRSQNKHKSSRIPARALEFAAEPSASNRRIRCSVVRRLRRLRRRTCCSSCPNPNGIPICAGRVEASCAARWLVALSN